MSTFTSGIKSKSKGFTLIELLVVILVILVLVGLLAPALGKARRCVRATREMSGARQVMVAFEVYAETSRGRVLTGFCTPAMVAGPMPVNNSRGERLTGEVAQRYPWRLAPYVDYDFRGLYQSDKVLAGLLEHEEEYRPYGIDYDYVVSLYPSLGMNVAFVGGSDRLSEFDPMFVSRYGKVYLERTDQGTRPSEVMVFASARAQVQPALPIDGAPQGFFRLEPPVFTASRGAQWEAAYEELTPEPGLNSGFVSLRHDGRAVAAMRDGHAGLKNWEQMRDMRLWADGATHAAWGITAR